MQIVSFRRASQSYGDVTFADGAAYDWFIDRQSGGIWFGGWRDTGHGFARYTFRSAKRAAAVAQRLA